MEYRLEQLECDVYNHIHQCAHTSEELLKLMQLISSSAAFQIQSLNLASKLSMLEDQMGLSASFSTEFSRKNLIIAVAKSIGAVCSKIKVSPVNCDFPLVVSCRAFK
ncbi:uncharacterized protein LOC117650503 isoform X1 [Thrips palmi]|uniref:Uncharacterized protein LOC117650503 isoform X1 n=1 Tax=Thrips palmi TaxID=161013 RepID=A0A6P8ZYI8_THRPL|nr:uncharacterized protein LOC117650503 isoform X1 [Thrips palmi]